MVYQQQQQQVQGQMRGSYPNDPQGQGMKGPGGQIRPQHSYQGQGHQQSLYQQPDFDGHQSAINGN